MRKGKAKGDGSPADSYCIELLRLGVRSWPLFGLNRLVKVPQRSRNGIVHCDSVTSVSYSTTFSSSNARTSLYTLSFANRFPGVQSEPRLVNFVNEATEATARRFYEHAAKAGFKASYDDFTNAVVCFTPKKGQTYTVECDVYKWLDPGNRSMRLQLPTNARIETCTLSLDLSAYLDSGCTVDKPRCGYEGEKSLDKRAGAARPPAFAMLDAAETGAAAWEWKVENVSGGTLRLMWETEGPRRPRAVELVNLDKLETELSVNTRLAQDLHNFVRICHFYAAGFRSLNQIAQEMTSYRSILNRSLESIEKSIGTELISRTKGKGLILVSPAGEAVLDWWSQFYMRWTPIAHEPAMSKRSGRPRRARRT